MAGALNLPDALKQVKPYLTLATQLEQKNEKNVAYYCRLYALQHGMTINKSAPECKKFLMQLMEFAENTKAQNKNEEAIQTQIVGQACVERLALTIFQKADEEDRQSRFSKNLVKQFYTSGLLFDTLNYFGDLSEDLIAKKQYAKRKAMYLNRCFQTGEQPQPGPLIGEEYSDEYSNQTEAGHNDYAPPADKHSPPSNYNQYPKFDEAPPNPRPRSSNQIPEVPSHNYYQEAPPVNPSVISEELMQKAQKLCKYASSALQYEDIANAITNLEACLKILKTGK